MQLDLVLLHIVVMASGTPRHVSHAFNQSDIVLHVIDNKPEEYKIGFMAPWSASYQDFSALTSASAVSIAIERIHADPSFNNRFQFR